MAIASGCASNVAPLAGYVRPTIAVMKFENRAAFPLGWNLGDGMRDVLVDRLVATGRYHVIERPELDSVLDEIRLEQSGLTRPHDRATPGRLKNVQYLIKGTVTDFTHTAGARGFAGFGMFGIGGSGNVAVMGMTVYVVDVSSGEIICSRSLQESVGAGELDVRGVYKDVAFGGGVFARTPLGEATTQVIDRAVREVTAAIAARPWEPRVAAVGSGGDDQALVLNGGRERGLTEGSAFDVLEPGEPILDPDNGDVLGRRAGRAVGRVRLTEVNDRYSVGQIVAGDRNAFEVGYLCRRPPTTQPGR